MPACRPVLVRPLVLAWLLAVAWGAPALAEPAWRDGPGYRTYVIGDEAAPRPQPTSAGLLLSGGGDWNLEAYRWFTAKAGHGHIVVLRASGATDDQDDFYKLVGGVTSVRTFVFASRRGAYDRRLLAAVKAADGVYISGGDQAKYVRMWRGTPLSAVLDAAFAAGKPIGGTSAGLAVQGVWFYGAMDGGSITSAEALKAPLGDAVTIETGFLRTPLMARVLTDSHFDTRGRLGRLVAFLVKAERLAGVTAQTPDKRLIGLGIDEASALTVEEDGLARFHAEAPGKAAWVVRPGEVRDLAPGDTLKMTGAKVVGVGPGSLLNLKSFEVAAPAFVQIYDVTDGVLSPPRT
jgi:beta-aspartyl-peptidase (threonine type)